MATLDAMFKLHDGYTKTITKMWSSTDKIEKKVLSASGSVDKLDKAINKVGSSGAQGMLGINKSLTKFLSLTALAVATVKGMSISDEYINTRARLDIMNDGLQTTEELQSKIMDSAKRARGSYTEMASSIAKMGILAGDAFSSNNETIAFTELVQKSFKVGGADTQEQQSGTYQLTQAMAAGKLQGDEFKSIMENAPLIAEAIAKYTKVSKGELKKLSSDGVITADIIKNAMFAMSDDINAKFETMPKTWADYWTQIKNGAIEAFNPVIVKISELINTDGFNTFVDILIDGFNLIAIGLSGVINGFIWLTSAVQESWNVIWPLLTAIAMVAIPMLVAGLWATISHILTMVAAWALANLPMLAVIGCIAIIIMSLQRMGVTFDDVFGFVGGIVGVFVAGVYNYFIYMWNVVANFVNFIGNVFTNPVAAVQKLFWDMCYNVMGFIEGLAKGIEKLINSIPGIEVDITSGLTEFKNDLAAKSQSIADEAGLKEFVKTKDYMDYGFAYSKGRGIGTDVYGDLTSKVNDIFGKSPTAPNRDSAFDISSLLDGGALPVTNGKGGKKLNVDIDKEDIKYIKDLAERDYINKFSTATLAPNVQITFGDVHENADANKIAKVVETVLKDEIAIIQEG